MAVHKRVRQAGRKLVAHVRRAGQAIKRRRAGTVDAGDPEVSRLDERLQPLAKHVREGRFFESPWQLIRFRSLEGISDEDAVRTIAAWCKRQGFEMSFVTRLRLLSSGSDGRRHPIRPPTFLMAHAPRALNQGSAIVAGDCSHTSPVSLSRTASLLKASNTVNRWAGAAPYPSSA
jgi:hypothetical protein